MKDPRAQQYGQYGKISLIIEDQKRKLKGYTPVKEVKSFIEQKQPASQSVILERPVMRDLVPDQSNEVPDQSNERHSEKQEPLNEEKVFDKSAFAYSTTNAELIDGIEKNLSEYNPEITELDEIGKSHYDVALKLHKVFNEFVNDSRWQYCSKGKTDTKGNEWVGYNMSYENYVCSKSAGRVSATPIELFTYINDMKYIKDHSGLAKDVNVIQKYPVNMSLVRMRGERKMFMSAREFVTIKHFTLNSDGSIEVVSGSVEDEKCPLDKDYVRGDMKISGTRFVPVGNGETEMTTISIADPKGSIPNLIKSTAAKQQVSKVGLISQAFHKRFNQ